MFMWLLHFDHRNVVGVGVGVVLAFVVPLLLFLHVCVCVPLVFFSHGFVVVWIIWC